MEYKRILVIALKTNNYKAVVITYVAFINS